MYKDDQQYERILAKERLTRVIYIDLARKNGINRYCKATMRIHKVGLETQTDNREIHSLGHRGSLSLYLTEFV